MTEDELARASGLATYLQGKRASASRALAWTAGRLLAETIAAVRELQANDENRRRENDLCASHNRGLQADLELAHAQIRDRNDQLKAKQAENDRLRADAKRLDWYLAQPANWDPKGPWKKPFSRGHIDAAMSRELAVPHPHSGQLGNASSHATGSGYGVPRGKPLPHAGEPTDDYSSPDRTQEGR